MTLKRLRRFMHCITECPVIGWWTQDLMLSMPTTRWSCSLLQAPPGGFLNRWRMRLLLYHLHGSPLVVLCLYWTLKSTVFRYWCLSSSCSDSNLVLSIQILRFLGQITVCGCRSAMWRVAHGLARSASSEFVGMQIPRIFPRPVRSEWLE